MATAGGDKSRWRFAPARYARCAQRDNAGESGGGGACEFAFGERRDVGLDRRKRVDRVVLVRAKVLSDARGTIGRREIRRQAVTIARPVHIVVRGEIGRAQ